MLGLQQLTLMLIYPPRFTWSIWQVCTPVTQQVQAVPDEHGTVPVGQFTELPLELPSAINTEAAVSPAVAIAKAVLPTNCLSLVFSMVIC